MINEVDLAFKPKSLFENRAQASIELLDILPQDEFKNGNWLVLAISNGAVPFTISICKRFGLYFDMIFTEPIYAPNNINCEIAMVSETEEIVIHSSLVESFGINLDYIYNEANRKHEEKILKKVYRLRKGEHLSVLEDKNILLVDEGCESGLTVLSAIKTVINKNAKSVYFATPLIASDIVYDIQTVCDDIFCVKQIDNFVDTKHYYDLLPKLQAESIYAMLETSAEFLPFKKKQGDNI